ncbi:MAG: Undecaprenyl-phosphate 4-deoxy-4-formamido-L-arabinose transferase [Planctomycetes bacterium]|nr:Undecaprenyl-phosphate 4-deoxy-4-formamido-L-arabinose transferase [Planctomycetota bacterium]
MYKGPVRPSLSVVIPCYASAEILPELVARIDAALRPRWPDMELVLVCDGARDGTWEAVERECAARPWVRGIDLLRNFGQHNALLCGVRAARAPVIVTMDDDLQHPPEEAHRLVEELGRGFDVVYGVPQDEQHGLLRDLASRATKSAIGSATGVGNAPDISAYRAFRTQLRDAFATFEGTYVSLDVLLAWGTTRFGAVRVRHDPRKSGVSNYTFRKLARHAVNMFVGFGSLPLRLAVWVGFGFTLFGIGVLAYVIVRYLAEGTPVQGFPFLASIIAIFAGAQLFALGVIGEYVGRIHSHSMRRPTYVVRTEAVRSETSRTESGRAADGTDRP